LCTHVAICREEVKSNKEVNDVGAVDSLLSLYKIYERFKCKRDRLPMLREFVRPRNDADGDRLVVEHVLSLSLASILEVAIDLCSMIALAFMLFFNDFSSQTFPLFCFDLVLNNDTLNLFRDLLPFSHSLISCI
jgi:hypothetical protein